MSTTRRQRRSWGKIRKLTHGSGRFQASYVGLDLARHTAPANMQPAGWKPGPSNRAPGKAITMMGTALTDGLITTNPCTIRGASKAPNQRKAAVLSPDEVAKVALAIRPDKLKALVLIAAWLGLRRGEVTELRRQDVSADCSLITVARACTHRRGECHVSTPKSGKGREVFVPPHIRVDIRDHMAHHVGAAPDALLFHTNRACHFSEHTFRTAFTEALKSVGREHIRIHDLRHTRGTQTARVANLVETMARLGHSTVSASLTYQQISSGRDREIAEALSGLAQTPA